MPSLMCLKTGSKAEASRQGTGVPSVHIFAVPCCIHALQEMWRYYMRIPLQVKEEALLWKVHTATWNRAVKKRPAGKTQQHCLCPETTTLLLKMQNLLWVSWRNSFPSVSPLMDERLANVEAMPRRMPCLPPYCHDIKPNISTGLGKYFFCIPSFSNCMFVCFKCANEETEEKETETPYASKRKSKSHNWPAHEKTMFYLDSLPLI